MKQADRVARELVDPAYESDLTIVPEVHMVRWILRIQSRRNHQNQVALANHLDDFDATFDASLDAEPEWLQRENRETFRRPDCKCILVLIEADV